MPLMTHLRKIGEYAPPRRLRTLLNFAIPFVKIEADRHAIAHHIGQRNVVMRHLQDAGISECSLVPWRAGAKLPCVIQSMPGTWGVDLIEHRHSFLTVPTMLRIWAIQEMRWIRTTKTRRMLEPRDSVCWDQWIHSSLRCLLRSSVEMGSVAEGYVLVELEESLTRLPQEWTPSLAARAIPPIRKNNVHNPSTNTRSSGLTANDGFTDANVR